MAAIPPGGIEGNKGAQGAQPIKQPSEIAAQAQAVDDVVTIAHPKKMEFTPRSLNSRVKRKEKEEESPASKKARSNAEACINGQDFCRMAPRNVTRLAR